MRTDGAFTLSAQNMAYENGSWWLPWVEVSGRSKTQCVWCGNYYYADEAADHVCMQECEYFQQIASMPLVEHGGSFECIPGEATESGLDQYGLRFY